MAGLGRSGDRKDLPTVVVVDDCDDIRQLLKDILEMSGEFRCVAAYGDAGHALAGIPALMPEVVLMDIDLPGLSGLECLRQLKAWFPGLAVVMISARRDNATMADAVYSGCAGYLVKPFSVEQCLGALRAVVQRH